MKCPYSYSDGTQYSKQIQSGLDIDSSIGEEMKRQLWDIFTGTNSTTASYDWTNVPTEIKLEMADDTRIGVLEAEVPPGLL